MYAFLCDLGIESWRPINIEPIGRACESRDLLLSPVQFNELLSFIREKRFDHDGKMEVTFGCSHYLGLENERMVRGSLFSVRRRNSDRRCAVQWRYLRLSGC